MVDPAIPASIGRLCRFASPIRNGCDFSGFEDADVDLTGSFSFVTAEPDVVLHHKTWRRAQGAEFAVPPFRNPPASFDPFARNAAARQAASC
jgi:hypothetical protein